MGDTRSGNIVVHVDPDLADLIPGYLANRRKDVDAIRASLGRNDLELARVLGHGMKGSGGGYGFEAITEIGTVMEKAAKEGRDAEIRLQVDLLEEYLNQVEIVF